MILYHKVFRSINKSRCNNGFLSIPSVPIIMLYFAVINCIDKIRSILASIRYKNLSLRPRFQGIHISPQYVFPLFTLSFQMSLKDNFARHFCNFSFPLLFFSLSSFSCLVLPFNMFFFHFICDFYTQQKSFSVVFLHFLKSRSI